MKKWLLIILCVKTAFGFWWISTYFFSINNERERIAQEHTRLRVENAEKAKSLSFDMQRRIKGARTREEWEDLLAVDISSIGETEQQDIQVIVRSKLFEVLFWQAETLLARARGLLEQDQNNKIAGMYIEEARVIYEKIKGFMPDLGEIAGNPLWNARLYYLRGVYYFRSLVFIKNKQEERSKIEDAVAQSVVSLDKVFSYSPKDRDTQVAIEVLQKKAKEASAQGTTDDSMKLQLRLLPGKDKEIGPFQVGPREEGRH